MKKTEADSAPAGLKLRPEDFSVTELASYEPVGKGTHLWMRLEKRGLSTRAALGRLARELGVEARAFGFAGQKDARALTSQWVSLEHPPAGSLERLEALAGGWAELTEARPLAISAATWHKNRLGLGHLLGNRFAIRLRGLGSEASAARAQALAELAQTGAPNAFGPQRFGHRGDSGLIGRALLAGDVREALALVLGRAGELDTGRIREARQLFDAGDLAGARAAWPADFALERRLLGRLVGGDSPERALAAADRRALDFFRSAHQSLVFNRVLTARLAEPGGLELLAGDLAMRLPLARKAFVVEDLAHERERAARLEIAPSGPLFGPKTPWPTGRPLELETAALATEGLAPDQVPTGALPGGRRALLMRVDEPSASPGRDEHGAYLELGFTLAKGCYATSLLDALKA